MLYLPMRKSTGNALSTNEESHDPAVEVRGLADNDEGGAEGEEGPDDENTAVSMVVPGISTVLPIRCSL